MCLSCHFILLFVGNGIYDIDIVVILREFYFFYNYLYYLLLSLLFGIKVYTISDGQNSVQGLDEDL